MKKRFYGQEGKKLFEMLIGVRPIKDSEQAELFESQESEDAEK